MNFSVCKMREECSSMVEQRPFKPLVGGSSPSAPTNVFLGLSHNKVLFLHLPNCVLLKYCLILRTASDKYWFNFGSLTFRGKNYGYFHG